MSDAVGEEAFDAGLRRGAALFGAGDYFAAHEVWEELWRFGPEAERPWVHSLIHAAVALYHSGRGNPDGARRQVERGRRKAAQAPPVVRGIALARFWADVVSAVESPAGDRPPPTLSFADARAEP